ncbi:MAG: metal-sensitive transcriptional regulator [SAR324 cluster bacterium]|nr:metal-sensitive transcriptional regulator [SAR324 cluster bacterium]
MEAHPDHSTQQTRLRRIEGQVRGIQRMIEERRYCMDIIDQIHAISAALRKVESNILEAHLEHCVHDALHSKNTEDAQRKIREIVQILNKS